MPADRAAPRTRSATSKRTAPRPNGHDTTPSVDLARQPVSRVTWRHKGELTANDYNPNRVAPPEMELLILSILEDGWTQPIVILPDKTIVDGFHRWSISDDPRLLARYGGWVPTVTVDVDPVHRKMSTVRHNRARGTHVIVPMGEIVASMLTDGVTEAEVMRRLGMEPEEVRRLTVRVGMPVLASKGEGFGKAWVPSRASSDNRAAMNAQAKGQKASSAPPGAPRGTAQPPPAAASPKRRGGA